MNKVKNPIDYNELVNIIRTELIEVMNNNYEYYKGADVKISADLQYVKRAFIDNPEAIYIVVSFGPASVNFGHSVVTCSIRAISQKFHIEKTKTLLTEFAQGFNLEKLANGTIQQIYTSPSVVKNFEAVSFGLESILSCDGAFILSKTANFFDLYYFNLDLESIDTDEYFVVNEMKNLVAAVNYTGADSRRLVISKNNTFTIYDVSDAEIVPNETNPDYSCLTFPSAGEMIVGIQNLNVVEYYSKPSTITPSNGISSASGSMLALAHLLNWSGAFSQLKYFNIVFDGTNYKFYPVTKHSNLTDIGCDFIDSQKNVLSEGNAVVTLDSEKTLALDQTYGADFNLDSQVMYGDRNFSSSITESGTVAISFTSYLIFDSNLQNQALAMSMKMNSTLKHTQLIDTPKIVNQTFVLKIIYKNGYTLIDEFKCINFKAGQPVGELPSVAMSFTN